MPQFSKLPHAVIIGMQAPKDWQKTLVERMKKRGDSLDTIQKRLALIIRDSADLSAHKMTVNRHGRYFIIEDDTTIGEEIIPWLEGLL